MSAGRDADAPAPGGLALVIIDMISGWDFPDAEHLLPHAQHVATEIAGLAQACRDRGVPVIYANDNRGRWRSDFRSLVDAAMAQDGPGAEITRLMRPHEDDYFVLKPKHSIFHGTPMPFLLQHLRVQRLVLAGVSSDQCVLMSVSDARMRELDPIVPADCSASQGKARHQVLLQQLRETWKVEAPDTWREIFQNAPSSPSPAPPPRQEPSND
ncbi:isochorismatase family cysteine hydrolase [uncultured Pseudacidovorax sp.]|uniref:isochorismatase family cysteine hydrolase n=1 Tax=uncultured Pseudacidovorax sp. TaxID=679313 RepID=UPI0025D911A6|nr:isochorismatase family cysteine hydrolase [uncultured Pseudacidovorax sp.]